MRDALSRLNFEKPTRGPEAKLKKRIPRIEDRDDKTAKPRPGEQGQEHKTRSPRPHAKSLLSRPPSQAGETELAVLTTRGLKASGPQGRLHFFREDKTIQDKTSEDKTRPGDEPLRRSRACNYVVAPNRKLTTCTTI